MVSTSLSLIEQAGMRDMYSKTYSIEGKLQVVTSADPVHYMEDGIWQDIDMNVTTENGWEVLQLCSKSSSEPTLHMVCPSISNLVLTRLSQELT